MDIEAAAILRCWRVDVELAGGTYTIPALPAVHWLQAILEGSHFDLIPGLLSDEDGGDIDDQLVAGVVTYGEIRDAARAAIAAAAGMKWWTAERLAYAALSTWVGGELLLRGVDPERVSLGAYLAAAYRAVTRIVDEQKRIRIDMDLERPPVGLPPEEWFDEDEAAARFEAAMAAGG